MNFYNFNIFKKSVKFNATTYAYGVKEENRLLIPLQQFFNDDTLRPMPDVSKFDFVGEGGSRSSIHRCNKNHYHKYLIHNCDILLHRTERVNGFTHKHISSSLG